MKKIVQYRSSINQKLLDRLNMPVKMVNILKKLINSEKVIKNKITVGLELILMKI